MVSCKTEVTSLRGIKTIHPKLHVALLCKRPTSIPLPKRLSNWTFMQQQLWHGQMSLVTTHVLHVKLQVAAFCEFHFATLLGSVSCVSLDSSSAAVMPSKIDGKKVGFVGAGAMAEALARGFVDKKVIESSDIWCCDPSKSRMDVFTDFGANAVKDGPEVRSSFVCP